MLDLSFWEILIVVCAGVIFLKPEDLPKIAKTIGQFVRKVKSYTKEINDIFLVDENSVLPKTTKIIGEDGKEHIAYDLKEVFPEETKK